MFDTCTIVNLHKGGVLGRVLNLAIHRFLVGPEVLDECANRCQPLLDGLVNESVTLLDDSGVPASLFLDLLNLHHLGDGETECLVYAQLHSTYIICSDDRAARTVATRLYGQARVMGSIRLLLQCITHGILSEDEAFSAYEEMLRAGGFLPTLTRRQFLTA